MPTTAIPIPASIVPAYSGQVCALHARRPDPAAIKATPIEMGVVAPSRAAARCAGGAKRPMHKTGSAVSAPIHPELRPRSVAMSRVNGGTLAITARKFAESASTASSRSPGATTGRAGGEAVSDIASF